MSRQFEALRSFPPEVPEVSRRKQKLGVLIEKRKEWRQAAAVDRKLESAESGRKRGGGNDAGTKGVPQMWSRRTTLVEEVGISCAQAHGRERTQRRRYIISRKPQKEVSLWRLWECTCCVLLRRGHRASKIWFGRCFGHPSRPSKLQAPVPWSWAPFAEFMWQAVDERRHRSSHRERRRRRELHGGGLCVTRVGWSDGLLKTPPLRLRRKNLHKCSSINVSVTQARRSHDRNR